MNNEIKAYIGPVIEDQDVEDIDYHKELRKLKIQAAYLTKKIAIIEKAYNIISKNTKDDLSVLLRSDHIDDFLEACINNIPNPLNNIDECDYKTLYQEFYNFIVKMYDKPGTSWLGVKFVDKNTIQMYGWRKFDSDCLIHTLVFEEDKVKVTGHNNFSNIYYELKNRDDLKEILLNIVGGSRSRIQIAKYMIEEYLKRKESDKYPAYEHIDRSDLMIFS